MLYLMLCGPGFMGALAMVGIPPQGSPGEYVFLFLTGFGAVASLVALTWPKHGSSHAARLPVFSSARCPADHRAVGE